MTVIDFRMATYHVLSTVGSKDVKRNVAPYWARQGHNCAGRGVSADGNPSSKEALPGTMVLGRVGSVIKFNNLSQGKNIQVFLV